MMWLTMLLAAAVFILLAFFRVTVTSWLLAVMVIVPVVAMQARLSDEVLKIIYILLILGIAIFGIPYLRRKLVSGILLRLFRKTLPIISSTEQEAIDAGTVWWDGELFSGHPGWEKLLAYPKCGLNAEEEAFLDNEVEELCSMLDDWDITHNRADLPESVWQYIRGNGFFGMIIPKEYGGLGFSAQAHSAVIAKIASRCSTAAVTVMVPNSLGPSELLLRYGTEEQKESYLKRLARGQEIPCFALTGPYAGSDAGSIPDTGIVCRRDFSGKKEVLGVLLNWEKRYITLAPKATLLGLAFRLHDPDGILGGDADRGITLALIPTDIEGVSIGRRHFPMHTAFLNGPTSGRDVFIPMDCLIGGEEHIGQGWRMLMECLSSGRAISLPASSVGGMKMAARTSGAYCRVRHQFNQPIGRFEGVGEALARIGAQTYMTDSARSLTALALDMGEKPSVISAIIKYQSTERGRIVINNAMDLHGGKGICLGPSNYLGSSYQQIPIGITVEGANILTRSLMIFGQGAVRSHPYVLKEIAAAKEPDFDKALHMFDDALFGHVGFALSNAARSLMFGLTGGRGMPVPKEGTRYYQQITRFSCAFALSADVAMAVLGGSLKRRENISARLGDVLGLLYLCSATMKRFADDGHPSSDLPLLHWAIQDALHDVQQALGGLIRNFPNALVRCMLRALIFPLGMRLQPPSDRLGHEVAGLLMQPGDARDRLTRGIYVPKDENDAIGALEAALLSAVECEPLNAKLNEARREGKLKAADARGRIREARDAGLINEEEVRMLERDHELSRKVIMVDDFDPGELQRRHGA